MNYRITTGILKPEKQITDLNEMRQEIDKATSDSVLVRNCMIQARIQGLSGEDTYVLLAYHSLLLLEEHSQALTDMLSMITCPPNPLPP